LILSTRLEGRCFSAIFENWIGDECRTVPEANLLYDDFNSHFVTNPIRCAAPAAATRRFTDKGTPEVILGRKAKAFEILYFRLPILD